MQNIIVVKDLGLIAYKEAWDMQEDLLKKKADEKSKIRNLKSEITDTRYLTPDTPNHLLFAEHPPVYTLGKNGKQQHVLIDEETRKQKGIEYFHINRGGDITFHGPGQVVGYPIIDLDEFKPDLGWYLRSLEEVIILVLNDYGIKGERSKGETGVWIDAGKKGSERKICAMGIRCSRWITMHGFALNVNTDLSFFNYIVPCGIANKQVTSIEKELGHKVDMNEVKQKIAKYFAEIFETEVVK